MSRRSWLLASSVLRFTAVLSFGMLLQLRMRELGASLVVISLLSTIRGGVGAFSAPIWGAISDRQKKRTSLMIFSLVAVGILYPLYVFTDVPLLFLLIAGAIGFFDSCFPTVAMALTTDNSKTAQSLSKEMSFLNTANSSGMLVGRYLLSALLLWFSVKTTIWWFAIIVWLAIVPLLFISESPRNISYQGSKRSILERLFPLTSDPSPLKNNGLWAMYVGSFIRQFAIAGVTSIIIIYMTERIGLLASLAAIISGLNPLFQTFSHNFSRPIIRKIGSRKCSILGIGLTALTPLFFAFSWNWILLAVGYISLGLTFGLFINGAGTFISMSAPQERRGEFLGLLRTARSMGIMLGPVTAGIIAQFSYRAMFLTMGISLIISAALVLVFTSETKEAIQ